MTERPNYYSIIPADVRYDQELKANEKLLYGEITALSNHKGYCFAANSYFADLYGVKKGTVSGWISNLEKKGYVKIELIYGANKQVKERRIYISSTLYDKNNIPPTTKDEYPMREKSQEELNITRTNITRVNNDYDDGENPEVKNSKNQKSKTEEPKPKTNKDVHTFFQKNINAMETPFQAETLEYWIKDLGVELVLEALERAVANDAKLPYAEAIMEDWMQKNVDSMEKVKQADLARKQKNQKKFNNRSNGPKIKEKTPYWMKDNSDPDDEPTDKPIDKPTNQPEDPDDSLIPDEQNASIQERIARLQRMSKEQNES